MKTSILKSAVFGAVICGLILSQSMSVHAAAYAVIGTGSVSGTITATDIANKTLTISTDYQELTVYCMPFDYLLNKFNYTAVVGATVTIAYDIRQLPDQSIKLAATSLTSDDITYIFVRPKT